MSGFPVQCYTLVVRSAVEARNIVSELMECMGISEVPELIRVSYQRYYGVDPCESSNGPASALARARYEEQCREWEEASVPPVHMLRLYLEVTGVDLEEEEKKMLRGLGHPAPHTMR